MHKAAGKGQPVTQEIAVSVKGDKVECAINGTMVGSYDKAASRRRRQAEVNRRRLRHPLRAQHRRDGDRTDGHEKLKGKGKREKGTMKLVPFSLFFLPLFLLHRESR